MNHTKYTALIGTLFFFASSQGCGSSEDGKTVSQNSGGSASNTGGIATNTTGGRTGGSSSTTRPATGGTSLTGGTVGTGGVSVSLTGGTFSTGGIPASGGTQNTGGTVLTGGTISTGGVMASGGMNTTLNQTGGMSAIVPPTGGTNSIGGMTATGGDTGTGGGSGACVPLPRPEPAVVSPAWNCDPPVRDSLLSVDFLHLAEKVVGITESNIWVLATEVLPEYRHANLLTWDGTAWSLPRLLVISKPNSECKAMARDSSPIRTTVWIGGHAECVACDYAPFVIRATVSGMYSVATQEMMAGLPAKGEVVSFWIGERRTFALLNDGIAAQVYEFVVSGNSQAWSLVTRFEGVTGKEIWGTSPNDLFVVGEQIGSSDASSAAFATHFDGCEWNQLSLSSDLISIKGIHGAGGTVILVGITETDSVRLVSSNLTDWNRSNSGEAKTREGSVWMTSSNAVLIGAESTDPNHLADGVITMGTSPWKSFFVEEGLAWGISSIARIPETNTYLMTSSVKTSNGSQAGIYRLSCREE